MLASRVLAVAFILGATGVAAAQHGGHAGPPSAGGFESTRTDSFVRNFTRAFVLQATDDQRLAFARCLEATERTHAVADQMLGQGARWRYDAGVFPRQEQQLLAALAEMDAAHQYFQHSLSQPQEKELRKHLKKLERYGAEMAERIAHLDRELSSKKPDPRRLYSDTLKIKEATEKWRSEHDKVAKEVGIGG